MTSYPLAYRDATELAGLIASGQLSPLELMERTLARLDQFEPRINAFSHVMRAEALAAARKAEARCSTGEPLPPLHGIPVSVKDLIAVGGVPYAFGSRAFADNIAAADAPAVERLRRAGAIVIGKTTTSELGCKAVGDSPLTGITRNPWDLSTTPGGSSAGAAASVAAGITPIALGTDGGGSIRIPAALTGLFGIKGQFGRVPVFPRSATPELAHVAPLSRSVRDAALLLGIISGYDARDPGSLPQPVPDFVQACDQPMRRFRIAWSPTFGYARPDPEVLAIVERAVQTLGTLGCEIELVEAPFGPDPADAWSLIFYSQVAARVESILKTDPDLLDPAVRPWLQAAKQRSVMDYCQAANVRHELYQRLRGLFDRFDLLVSPTLPLSSVEAGITIPPGFEHCNPVTWTSYTYPFNLTGNPAASVPVGFTTRGHPVGMQLVSRPYAEADLFCIASAFEAACPWSPAIPQALEAAVE
ncbi:amidase [Lacisediminimonas profundi]|uniref:amidase n=1 Tax=Lacisediminimonas profundi TaxID=2603856 RepID=UPI00124B8FCB|nr:amidase family protein [Lacisediminimonas profundi]